MRFSLLTLGALVASVFAAPSAPHVRHEKRNFLPPGWQKHDRMPGHQVLPMRIALSQSNLEKADDFLMDVSHPDSPNFGKHWTAKQVAETFAPSQESVDAVTAWLENSGVAPERIGKSQSMGWLTFDATVVEAENLLKTKFYMHKHSQTGKPHVGCSEYSVPDYVQPHVDFITPTVHFDTKIPQANILPKRQFDETKLQERAPQPIPQAASSTAAAGVPVRSKAAVNVIHSPTNGFLPKQGPQIDIQSIITELQNCNQFIVPDCLRALYRFPPNFAANPKNSYGYVRLLYQAVAFTDFLASIVEYTPQAFLQRDLDLFFANFSRNQAQRTPTTDLIDGATVQTSQQSFGFNGESDLDLQYAMALVNPQPVTLYQVGDIVEGASFNNFLDAIDGSYCSFEGGDDPTQDAVYPDVLPNGYTGPENCGGFAATKVISTSYGYNEADLTAVYEQRQCNEYMKLGLQGTTFVFSSGDNGVAGNSGQCISANGTYNDGTSGRFNPAFPSTCPYVTAVGATQIVPGASVTQPEEACETVIFSGGGFSNVFPLPSYQSDAVKSWFANYPPPYTSAQFNNSQQTRGYPDISANGANYVVAVDGAFSLVYGTSASTPVVGAILTLINEARFAVGKGPIGFINPTLYANPEALNDITSGGNQGCGTPGFTSVQGWDPVTGLGTPNFPKLVARFLSLP